jgi:hypothetical protein
MNYCTDEQVVTSQVEFNRVSYYQVALGGLVVACLILDPRVVGLTQPRMMDF